MASMLLPLLVTVPAPAEAPIVVSPALRVQALRLVDELHARLLATTSATATLQQWCAEQHLAEVPRIVAVVDHGVTVSATAQQRADLQVGPDEPLGYRRVRLTCGGRTLSEAENWFVPSRLTPAIRAALAGGNTPFGTLIEPLQPTRHTLASERLWSPSAADVSSVVPHALLRNRALVVDGQDRPLAEVIETYTSGVLAGLSAR